MRVIRFLYLLAFCGPGVAHAAEVQVAVAANFAGPMAKIAVAFAQDTGHKAIPIIGATGRLYAQILNGAPFGVLLSGDDTTPIKLEAAGRGTGRFTYARGALALWSKQPDYVDAQGSVLKTGKFRFLAIANPKLAPYGLAAVETLKALSLHESVAARFVTGESIAQTYQFVDSGNAELGFVALAQVLVPDRPVQGSYWRVPTHLHTPILQDAILLKAGEGNPAATAFLKYLRGPRAGEIIKAFGYER